RQRVAARGAHGGADGAGGARVAGELGDLAVGGDPAARDAAHDRAELAVEPRHAGAVVSLACAGRPLRAVGCAPLACAGRPPRAGGCAPLACAGRPLRAGGAAPAGPRHRVTLRHRAMEIQVRYFAVLRERLGREEERLALPDGADVAAAVEALAARHEAVRALRGRFQTAVNQEMVPASAALCDGDELALIPPVAGGAPERHARMLDEP